MKSIYLIGSLRNPTIPEIGNILRDRGFDVFDDWFAAGKFADDEWRDYEKARGHSYGEALNGLAAHHVFHFDLEHLNRCHVAVLVMPCGRSGHMELGFMMGQGKPGYVLMDNQDRYDVMYLLCHAVKGKVIFALNDLIKELKDGSQHS